MRVFVDYVKVYVKGGDGGNGCISFRREKYVSRGGPDGGDGGDGGDVIFETAEDVFTLLDVKYKPHFVAGRGGHGKGKNQSGKCGREVVVKVPVGTIISDEEGELADLKKVGQRFIAANGGTGGKGNQHYATPSFRTPRIAQDGKPGGERHLILELKLIADVGLFGLPNAGKSTLLSKLTSATPKIAPYPFTTLHPNLGVYETPKGERIIFADIPGLIEGASKGAGLGDKFLRHIERTSILVHLVSFEENLTDPESLLYAHDLVVNELKYYSEKLAQKDRIVTINKIDMVSLETVKKVVQFFSDKGIDAIPISAKDSIGLDVLLKKITRLIKDIKS